MATDHTISGRTSLRPTTEPPQETGHDKAAPDKIARCAENEVLLDNRHVCAFLKAIAEAEGGGYDFKYGAIKGRQNDPWRFADFSTHPGAGFKGTTAAGMYQITLATWREFGSKIGRSDFSPKTQDLIAVELLRSIGVIESIQAGDIARAIGAAARKWASLPMGPACVTVTRPSPSCNSRFFTGRISRMAVKESLAEVPLRVQVWARP